MHIGIDYLKLRRWKAVHLVLSKSESNIDDDRHEVRTLSIYTLYLRTVFGSRKDFQIEV